MNTKQSCASGQIIKCQTTMNSFNGIDHLYKKNDKISKENDFDTKRPSLSQNRKT